MWSCRTYCFDTLSWLQRLPKWSESPRTPNTSCFLHLMPRVRVTSAKADNWLNLYTLSYMIRFISPSLALFADSHSFPDSRILVSETTKYARRRGQKMGTNHCNLTLMSYASLYVPSFIMFVSFSQLFRIMLIMLWPKLLALTRTHPMLTRDPRWAKLFFSSLSVQLKTFCAG